MKVYCGKGDILCQLLQKRKKLLPLYPYGLGWMQQEQYDQWVRNYAEVRRKYFEDK